LFLSEKEVKLGFLTEEWLIKQAELYSDFEIASSLGVRQGTIRHHRLKYGIPSFTELTGKMKMKDSGEIRRRGTHSKESSESLKTTYFKEINEPEKAYWIGVLATDGCVSENSRISLSQIIRDAPLVDAFASTVGAEMFIKTRKITNELFLGKTKTKIMRVVRFTSKQMATDLQKELITPKKTKSLSLSPCGLRFPEAYLKGCLDGDGCVGKINFSFSSGSEIWVDQARQLILDNTGHSLAKYQRISKDTNREVFVLQGLRRDQPVLEWLYSEKSGFSQMERKFRRFNQYWLERTSSYWKDKIGTRALVDSLPSVLDSESSR
jgi:hypothetical protein